MKTSNDYAEYAKKKIFSRIDMPTEKIALVLEYLEAMSEFYELIPMTEVYRIVSMQNEGIDEDEFYKVAEAVKESKDFYFAIYSYEEYYDEDVHDDIRKCSLMQESVYAVAEDIYENLLEQQEGKEFYVPEKEKLLKYASGNYIDYIPQLEKIEEFFGTVSHESKISHKEMAEEIYLHLHTCYDWNFEYVLREIARLKYMMTEKQVEDFIPLLDDLIKNTRFPITCGYTITEKPEYAENYELDAHKMYSAMMKADEYFEELSALFSKKTLPVKVEKIDRNAPCPCGSGKKYKKCCALK